jgi:hypothetical protein
MNRLSQLQMRIWLLLISIFAGLIYDPKTELQSSEQGIMMKKLVDGLQKIL